MIAMATRRTKNIATSKTSELKLLKSCKRFLFLNFFPLMKEKQTEDNERQIFRAAKYFFIREIYGWWRGWRCESCEPFIVDQDESIYRQTNWLIAMFSVTHLIVYVLLAPFRRDVRGKMVRELHCLLFVFRYPTARKCAAAQHRAMVQARIEAPKRYLPLV